MGPPLFPELPAPTWEEFCSDWEPHYWTHESPARGRLFLILADGARVGVIAHSEMLSTSDARRACEIDLWLAAPELTGRGHGPAAIERICALVAREMDIEIAFIQPSARNPAAVRAYEKAGFRRCAMSGEEAAAHFGTRPDYRDSVFLERELAERPHVELLPADFDRGALAELFALADDSEQELRTYRDQGDVFAIFDGGDLVGHALMYDHGGGTFELKSLAVRKDRQGRGLGSRLLREALAALARRGVSRVTLATGAADVSNLRFYQRLGFRFAAIERDWFTPERGYPAGLEVDGIPLLDRVWLDLELDPS